MMKSILIVLGIVAVLSSCKSGREKLVDSISVDEKKLFADSTRMLNDTVAEEVLKSYKEFVEKYPADSLAPSCLFKAADLANGMRRYKEAIDLYGQFREKFPDHRKSAAGLFLQAFIYDSNLHDKEKAKQLYSEFLQKYPTHDLAPSAKASLDQINMGLSDEQLIKLFQARSDSIANK